MDKNRLCNGFLVTALPNTVNNYQYRGVDNDVWPVEVKRENNSLLSCIHENLIDMTDRPFLIDLQTLQAYLQAAKLQPVRTLYCEAESPEKAHYSQILHNKYAVKEFFLGYDYAWPNGDYYSAVLNDLIYRNIPSLEEHASRLNLHGLFQTEQQVTVFAEARKKLAMGLGKEDAIKLLEGGTFCKFKIFTVEDAIPLEKVAG